MAVNIEDFNKLQKTVDNLMKIIGAFKGSLHPVKERVSELETKITDEEEEEENKLEEKRRINQC